MSQSSLSFVVRASPILRVDQLVFFDTLVASDDVGKRSQEFVHALANSSRDEHRSTLNVYRLYLEQTIEQAMVEQANSGGDKDELERLVSKGAIFRVNDVSMLSSHLSTQLQKVLWENVD